MTQYEKTVTALIVGLIASLPFYSVRNSLLVFSLPLVFLFVIAGLMLIRTIMTLRLPMAVTRFDIAILCYFSLAILSLALSPIAEGARTAFAKSAIYFATYLTLKMMLRELPIQHIKTALKTGVVVGTFSFVVTAVLCLTITGKLTSLAGSWSYSSVTITTFSSIDAVIGSQRLEDFESKNVMRNAVAETFVFYFLCTLIFRFQSQVLTVSTFATNVLLIICTFSRSAFWEVVLVVFGRILLSERGLRRGLAAICIIGGVAGSTLLIQEESRLGDFSGGSRLEQYTVALRQFSDSPYWGTGYASTLEGGYYVHNFVLASAAMLGFAGLIVALYVFTSTVISFLGGLKSRELNTSIFLIIPILGMLVGSAVEGIFTITGWISFAFYAVCTEKSLESPEPGRGIKP